MLRTIALSALVVSTLAGTAAAQCQQIWLPSGGAAQFFPDHLATWHRSGGDVLLVGSAQIDEVLPETGAAVYTGAQWQGIDAALNGRIRTTIPSADSIIIAGDFTSAGGAPRNYITRFGPAGWQSYPGLPGPVTAAAIHQGQLIAGAQNPAFPGGPFVWNGSAWTVLGPGLFGSWSDIVSIGTDLYAFGSFVTSLGVPLGGGIRWHGSQWLALPGTPSNTLTAVEHQGSLYIGGNFTTAGGVAASNVARWNGSTWEPVGAGLPTRVSTLVSAPDGLYTTQTTVFLGSFTSTHLVRWNGSSWDRVSPDTTPSPFSGGQPSLARVGSDWYFNAQTGLHKWDGASLTTINDGPRAMSDLDAVANFNGQLIVAGDVAEVGPQFDDHGVALWNGSDWQQLSTTSILDGIVRDLINVPGGLVAVGYATTNNNPSASLTLWDGAQWTPVSTYAELSVNGAALFQGDYHLTGTSLFSGQPEGIGRLVGDTLEPLDNIKLTNFTRPVVFQDELIIAATSAVIQTPPATVSNAILAWNGSAWRTIPHPPQFSGAITDLAVHDNRLIAVGGSSTPITVAAWDGSSWTALGSPVMFFPSRLVSIDSRLFAFGGSSMGMWDGASWSTHQAAIGMIDAAPFNNEVIIVGNFAETLNGHPAVNWARWGIPDAATSCPADLTTSDNPGQPGYGIRDGVVSNADFFYYLTQFARANLAVCDLTASALSSDPCYGRANGILNNDDFFVFLSLFAAGC